MFDDPVIKVGLERHKNTVYQYSVKQTFFLQVRKNTEKNRTVITETNFLIPIFLQPKV